MQKEHEQHIQLFTTWQYNIAATTYKVQEKIKELHKVKRYPCVKVHLAVITRLFVSQLFFELTFEPIESGTIPYLSWEAVPQ